MISLLNAEQVSIFRFSPIMKLAHKNDVMIYNPIRISM